MDGRAGSGITAGPPGIPSREEPLPIARGAPPTGRAENLFGETATASRQCQCSMSWQEDDVVFAPKGR